MWGSLQRLIDVVASVGILVLLSLMAYDRVVTPTPAETARNPSELYLPGEALEFATNAEQALVIGLNSTCRFCTDSMPLFRTLYEQTKAQNAAVRVIAVSAEPIDVTLAYLKSHGVTMDDIVTVPSTVRLVSFTPTVAFVGEGGKVRKLGPALSTPGVFRISWGP